MGLPSVREDLHSVLRANCLWVVKSLGRQPPQTIAKLQAWSGGADSSTTELLELFQLPFNVDLVPSSPQFCQFNMFISPWITLQAAGASKVRVVQGSVYFLNSFYKAILRGSTEAAASASKGFCISCWACASVRASVAFSNRNPKCPCFRPRPPLPRMALPAGPLPIGYCISSARMRF